MELCGTSPPHRLSLLVKHRNLVLLRLDRLRIACNKLLDPRLLLNMSYNRPMFRLHNTNLDDLRYAWNGWFYNCRHELSFFRAVIDGLIRLVSGCRRGFSNTGNVEIDNLGGGVQSELAVGA